MNALLLPAVAALLALAEFLIALASHSLRDFSRSELEEVCRDHADEARFSSILRQYESALLASDVLLVINTAALLAVLSLWSGLPEPAVPPFTLGVLAVLTIAGLLLIAVILPWSVARVSGEVYLYHVWPVLLAGRTILLPVLWITRHLDKFIHRLSGRGEPTPADLSSLTEEIRSVVDEGQREGLLESGARTMIHRVMELSEVDVAAIMTPRTDMVCIESEMSLEEARMQLLESGHSRLPVIGESTDDIIGMLYAKDLLNYMHRPADEPAPPLSGIVRDPFYVPETMGVDSLLETMKQQRIHIAIVLDEYGGVAGLVTLEDILEEIVGEIADEYDKAEEILITEISPGVTEVDARVRVDDLNDQFSYEIPEDGDYDTIGGFVVSRLGRIPEPGEVFTWQQLRFTVLQADKRKIDKVLVEVDKTLATTPGEEET